MEINAFLVGLWLVAFGSGAQLRPGAAATPAGPLTAPLPQTMPQQTRPQLGPKAAAGASTPAALASATDPVCGMGISPATTHRAAYQGKTYGFCSASCRGTFAAKPQHYIREAPGR